MRTLLYSAAAAVLGGFLHAGICGVLLVLSGVGLGSPPLPLLDGLLAADPLPLATSMLTSLVTALALRRFIARLPRRSRLAPVSLGFWALGGALWPLVWILISLVDATLRQGWSAAIGDGEVVFLALTAPYLGLAVSAVLIWIVWPLTALEVWLLARILHPAAARTEDADEYEAAAGPATG